MTVLRLLGQLIGRNASSCTKLTENRVSVASLFNQLQRAAVFSKKYLISRYHQLKIRPQNIPKTAFMTYYGHYKFFITSFELTNASASLMSLMNGVLMTFLVTFVIVFLYDVLVYLKSEEEHANHFRTILGVLGKC